MNTSLNMTQHALQQSQRRCLDSRLIEYAWMYGRHLDAGRGCIRCFFDRRARNSLKEQLTRQEYARIEKKLNCYVVLTDDQETVITAAYKTKKFRSYQGG